MLVKNWMSKDVVTVDENYAMSTATKLMKENSIRMLPVLKNNKLTGVITDRDLKRASASDATTLEVHELLYLLSNIKVKGIMTKNPITVSADHTVEETAEILLENKISGAPVVHDKGKVVGVITQVDIFKVLISLTGVGKRGIQFAFLLKDEPGSIKVIADAIRKYGGRMVSILTSYESATHGYRKVYIRMYDIDRENLENLKKEFRETATLLYMVDHQKNKRESY
jgi:acetoin utilization protein AcuB